LVPANRLPQVHRVALLLQRLKAFAVLSADATPTQQPIRRGERLVVALTRASSLSTVALIKRDPLDLRLVEVGEQPQSAIELAKPLLLLRSLQAMVSNHPAHQHSAFLFNPSLILGFVVPQHRFAVKPAQLNQFIQQGTLLLTAQGWLAAGGSLQKLLAPLTLDPAFSRCQAFHKRNILN
jgi:hypothetical protein